MKPLFSIISIKVNFRWNFYLFIYCSNSRLRTNFSFSLILIKKNWFYKLLLKKKPFKIHKLIKLITLAFSTYSFWAEIFKTKKICQMCVTRIERKTCGTPSDKYLRRNINNKSMMMIKKIFLITFDVIHL